MTILTVCELCNNILNNNSRKYKYVNNETLEGEIYLSFKQFFQPAKKVMYVYSINE